MCHIFDSGRAAGRVSKMGRKCSRPGSSQYRGPSRNLGAERGGSGQLRDRTTSGSAVGHHCALFLPLRKSSWSRNSMVRLFHPRRLFGVLPEDCSPSLSATAAKRFLGTTAAGSKGNEAVAELRIVRVYRTAPHCEQRLTLSTNSRQAEHLRTATGSEPMSGSA